jgi:hypothetical protein
MKKIRNIKQLKAEKKQLNQRQVELEKAMKYDWRDLKDNLRPHEKEKKKENTFNTFFADSASKIVATFAQKLAEKAETKIGKWFKK